MLSKVYPCFTDEKIKVDPTDLKVSDAVIGYGV